MEVTGASSHSVNYASYPTVSLKVLACGLAFFLIPVMYGRYSRMLNKRSKRTGLKRIVKDDLTVSFVKEIERDWQTFSNDVCSGYNLTKHKIFTVYSAVALGVFVWFEAVFRRCIPTTCFRTPEPKSVVAVPSGGRPKKSLMSAIKSKPTLKQHIRHSKAIQSVKKEQERTKEVADCVRSSTEAVYDRSEKSEIVTGDSVQREKPENGNILDISPHTDCEATVDTISPPDKVRDTVYDAVSAPMQHIESCGEKVDAPQLKSSDDILLTPSAADTPVCETVDTASIATTNHVPAVQSTLSAAQPVLAEPSSKHGGKSEVASMSDRLRGFRRYKGGTSVSRTNTNVVSSGISQRSQQLNPMTGGGGGGSRGLSRSGSFASSGHIRQLMGQRESIHSVPSFICGDEWFVGCADSECSSISVSVVEPEQYRYNMTGTGPIGTAVEGAAPGTAPVCGLSPEEIHSAAQFYAMAQYYYQMYGMLPAYQPTHQTFGLSSSSSPAGSVMSTQQSYVQMQIPAPVSMVDSMQQSHGVYLPPPQQIHHQAMVMPPQYWMAPPPGDPPQPVHHLTQESMGHHRQTVEQIHHQPQHQHQQQWFPPQGAAQFPLQSTSQLAQHGHIQNLPQPAQWLPSVEPLQPLQPHAGYESPPPILEPPPHQMIYNNDRNALVDAVRNQIEFYFSPANLVSDTFMKQLMDRDGYVLLEEIAAFPMITSLQVPADVLLEAVQSSSYLDVLMPSQSEGATTATAGVDVDDAYLVGGEYSGTNDGVDHHQLVPEEQQQQEQEQRRVLAAKVRCVDNPTMWVMV